MKENILSTDFLVSIQSLLDRQIELAEEVFSITRAEKDALIKMDTDSLFSLAKSKSDKLELIAEGDWEIKAKLAEISPKSPIKLLDLLPSLGAEESARLKQKRNRLVEIRKTIISDNIVNQNFSANVLGYLEDAVSLIVNGLRENPVYNRQKRGQQDKSRPALLSREI